MRIRPYRAEAQSWLQDFPGILSRNEEMPEGYVSKGWALDCRNLSLADELAMTGAPYSVATNYGRTRCYVRTTRRDLWIGNPTIIDILPDDIQAAAFEVTGSFFEMLRMLADKFGIVYPWQPCLPMVAGAPQLEVMVKATDSVNRWPFWAWPQLASPMNATLRYGNADILSASIVCDVAAYNLVITNDPTVTFLAAAFGTGCVYFGDPALAYPTTKLGRYIIIPADGKKLTTMYNLGLKAEGIPEGMAKIEVSIVISAAKGE